MIYNAPRTSSGLEIGINLCLVGYMKWPLSHRPWRVFSPRIMIIWLSFFIRKFTIRRWITSTTTTKTVRNKKIIVVVIRTWILIRELRTGSGSSCDSYYFALFLLPALMIHVSLFPHTKQVRFDSNCQNHFITGFTFDFFPLSRQAFTLKLNCTTISTHTDD